LDACLFVCDYVYLCDLIPFEVFLNLNLNVNERPEHRSRSFFDTCDFEFYHPGVIQVTANAARRIRELTSGRQVCDGLRLFIEKGGCAGLSYGMSVAPAEPTDQRIEQEGARLFVAADSAPLLDACTLDYEEELTHTGFKIVNPKAKQTCGCGTSFEA